jgi:hypothetical protein
MAVPDTETFTLQDVVDEVNPQVELSLEASFTASQDWLFDPDYQSVGGYHTRLSNFRNYGYIEPIVANRLFKHKFVASSISSFWWDVAADSVGDNLLSGISYNQSNLDLTTGWPYLGDWGVDRLYVRFDLLTVPEFYEIESATLEFDVETPEYQTGSEYNGFDTVPKIVQMDYIQFNDLRNDDFVEADWDNATSDEVFISKSSSDDHVIAIANTADKTYIKGLFGRSLQMCFRENNDFNEVNYVNWGFTAGVVPYYTGTKLSNIKLSLILRYPEL